MVAKHFQYVGVSTASCQRCGRLLRRETRFYKFLRFALKQDGKGRMPNISAPPVVLNKIVP